MKEFSRGIEVEKVIFSDGTTSKISHLLKNGIGMMYWYSIQLPCGGWCEFDIRYLVDESEIPKDTILTTKSLPFLANLLSNKNWKELPFLR